MSENYYPKFIADMVGMIRKAIGEHVETQFSNDEGWVLTDGDEAIIGGLGLTCDDRTFYKELCAFLIGVRFMEKRADGVVTYFMWYMFNKWSHEESIYVFGEYLGEHIWNKYTDYRDKLEFYGSIDNECRNMLVKRAIEIYKNK